MYKEHGKLGNLAINSYDNVPINTNTIHKGRRTRSIACTIGYTNSIINITRLGNLSRCEHSPLESGRQSTSFFSEDFSPFSPFSTFITAKTPNFSLFNQHTVCFGLWSFIKLMNPDSRIQVLQESAVLIFATHESWLHGFFLILVYFRVEMGTITQILTFWQICEILRAASKSPFIKTSRNLFVTRIKKTQIWVPKFIDYRIVSIQFFCDWNEVWRLVHLAGRNDIIINFSELVILINHKNTRLKLLHVIKSWF